MRATHKMSKCKRRRQSDEIYVYTMCVFRVWVRFRENDECWILDLKKTMKRI